MVRGVSRGVTVLLVLGGLAACAGITGLADYEITDVDAAILDASSAFGEAGVDGSSSSGAGSTSGMSSGTPADAPAKYVREICRHRLRCLPKFFAAHYPAGQTDCESRFRALQTQSGSSATAVQYDACAAKLAAADCTQREDDFPECTFRGSAVDGAACIDGRRCASGRCKRADAKELCGACAPLAAENEPCIDALDCGAGLWCRQRRCAKKVAENDECEPGTNECPYGHQCVGGECRKGAAVGDPCTGMGAAECRSSLVCNQRKCEEVGWAKLGEKCSADVHAYTSCVGSSCADQVCKPLRKIGEDCANDGTKPLCDDTSTCVDTGRCVALDASSCPK